MEQQLNHGKENDAANVEEGKQPQLAPEDDGKLIAKQRKHCHSAAGEKA